MQTATSETASKFLDLSIYVYHYTLRHPVFFCTDLPENEMVTMGLASL